MCLTRCMTSSFQKLLRPSFASCDLWLCHLMWPVTWQHDLHQLTLTLVLKKENKMKRKIKLKSTFSDLNSWSVPNNRDVVSEWVDLHITPCHVLMTITHLPCIYLKASMSCPCALTSHSLISIVHVYTICTSWESYAINMFLDVTLSPSWSF